MSESGDVLKRGIEALGLTLAADFEHKVRDYLSLLLKWNRVYNLTAVRDSSKLVSHHILDSLAIVKHLSGSTVVDVGSGPGLPGIPLALARPDWKVTLVDSNQKKTAFLSQAVGELGLTNVSVRRERVELWQPPKRFDIVVSRAFADLADFVKLAAHLVAPGGRMYAMKGLYPNEELAQLPPTISCEPVLTLDVPFVEGHRHLIVMKPTGVSQEPAPQ